MNVPVLPGLQCVSVLPSSYPRNFDPCPVAKDSYGLHNCGFQKISQIRKMQRDILIFDNIRDNINFVGIDFILGYGELDVAAIMSS